MEPLDLQELRRIDKAVVYKAGVPAGLLRRNQDGGEFSYREDYLAGGGRPVATTLPLTDEPTRTHSGAVPPFFAGLLPEGRRLMGLQRALKTSADDEFSLLLAVGRDPVGDVQVVPEGTEPTRPPPMLQMSKSWTEVSFTEVLRDTHIDRVGLPGVQDKVSAGMITLPVGRRYLLKVDPPDWPNVVEDEAFFLERARKARMRSAKASVVADVDGRAGLLVQRFDRTKGKDGSTVSLACEDACQVLGLWPADKYHVTCEEAVNGLAALCAARDVAARSLFQQVCFAWLTGNGDQHAKNLSILATEDGEWRVSPAYDLPSTVPYGDATFALRLQDSVTGLSRRKLLAFGKAVDLPEKVCTKVLDGLLASLEDLDEVLAEGALPFTQQRTADLRAELRNRRRMASPGR